MSRYKDPMSDHRGDLMTVQDFKERVKLGAFIDFDGYGYPVKDNMVDSKRRVKPSSVLMDIPSDATHILWFNR